MTRSSEVLIGSRILTRETRTRDAIKPSFRAGHFRCWPIADMASGLADVGF